MRAAICFLVGSICLSSSPTGAAVVLDQEHLNGFSGWIISQPQPLGQSFTVGKAGILARVEAYLIRHQTVPNAGVNLDLHSVEHGPPPTDRSQALATGTIPAASVSAVPWADWSGVDYGADGPCVLPGDVLGIVATTEADYIEPRGGTNPYAWRSPESRSEYSGGNAFVGQSQGIMRANPNDLAFRTYVDTGSQWRGGHAGHAADWGEAGNWSPSGVPAAVATFGTSGARSSVDLGDEDRTLRMAIFEPAVSTTIESLGGRSLILDNGGSPAPLVAQGTHRIEAPLAIPGDLELHGTGQVTLAGPIRGSGGLIHGSSGTTTLAAPGTFTGPTQVVTGTLQIEDPQALAQSTLNMRGQDAGVIRFGGITEASLGGLAGQRNLELANTAGAALALSVGGNHADTTYYGSLVGKGGLDKIGTGTLTLTGISTYEGPTLVSQGVLRLVQGTPLTGFGGDGEGWTVNNNDHISGPPFANDVLTLTTGGSSQARSAFYSQTIPAAGGFTVDFTYSIDNSNPADGITFTIQNDSRGAEALGGRGHTLGYAAENNNPAISPSLALEFNIFGAGRGVRWATNGEIGDYLSTAPVSFTSLNPIDVSILYDAGTQTLYETLHEQNTSHTKTFTWSGVDLSGILGATDAFVGFTGATGGWTATQRISNFSAMFQAARDWDLLPGGTALRIASGATLDLGGVDQTVGSLADQAGGGGTLLLGGSTLTFGTDDSDTVFSGVIDGKGEVVKIGSGKTILAGDHTYNGPTTIQSGTLVVNGSLSAEGDTLVQYGATLGGSGTIAGEVVVQAGGALAPGASVGMLTVDSLTLQVDSLIQFEFGPSGNDHIEVTAAGGLVIDGGILDLVNEDTMEPFSTPGTYPLIHYDGEIGGSGGLAALAILDVQPGVEYSFDVTSHPGWVSLTIVPEPATSVLLALGLLGLFCAWRRRR